MNDAKLVRNMKRIRNSEEVIEILYGRLHEFEKRMVSTANVAERFSLRQRIHDEIIPDIRKRNKEYADLLVGLTDSANLPSEESETILEEVVEAIDVAEKEAPKNTPQKMLQLLKEIKEKLNEPGKSAAAKLKLSLPIIPIISAYELELDTENFLTNVWRKVTNLFRRALPENPQ